MAKPQYISINEAAELADKSPQTIRRLIKANKIKYSKEKTAQGFHYMVDLGSLVEHYSLEIQSNEEPKATATATKQSDEASVAAVNVQDPEEFKKLLAQREHKIMVEYAPVAEFNKTLQALIQQHAREKENLFQLVEAFQNKVVSMESKMQAADSDKPWYRFW